MHNSCKMICFIILIFFLADICGIFVHLFELKIDNYLNPVIPNNNANSYLSSLRRSAFCNNHSFLTLVIKSEIDNFERRNAIRRSWGKGSIDVLMNRVFILGKRSDERVMSKVINESSKYNDIVQGDFIDTYFSNTRKTILGLHWVAAYCNNTSFILFVDDDYYVSIINVMRFLNSQKYNNLKHIFAGFVIQSTPHRHKFSKWYLSLQEYPYDRWPPYITAGSFLLSRSTLLELYKAISYTQPFRFDDIFLSLVALNAGIKLTHCKLFYFNKLKYEGADSYKHVVASHGYDDYLYMEYIWNECHLKGYA